MKLENTEYEQAMYVRLAESAVHITALAHTLDFAVGDMIKSKRPERMEDLALAYVALSTAAIAISDRIMEIMDYTELAEPCE